MVTAKNLEITDEEREAESLRVGELQGMREDK